MIKHKKIFLLIFVLLLAFPSVSCAETRKVSVAALGDSIAAGYNVRAEDCFVPVLSGLMTERGIDNTYVNLAVSGSKTTDLLDLLEKADVREELKDTDIFIISVGGNNFLLPAQEYLTGKRFNEPITSADLPDVIRNAVKALLAGKLPDDIVKDLFAGVEEIKRDIPLIIEKIREISPAAEIFILTNYNPFPADFFLYKTVEQLVLEANETITLRAKELDYIIIDTYTLFKNAEERAVNFYLPSWIVDIHPNAHGHRLIAETCAEEIEALPEN